MSKWILVSALSIIVILGGIGIFFSQVDEANTQRCRLGYPPTNTCNDLIVTDLAGQNATNPQISKVTIPLGASNPESEQILVPQTLTVVLGVNNTVVWTNQDDETSKLTADDNSWTTGPIKSGDSTSITFNHTGTFDYHGEPHPWQKGTIIVKEKNEQDSVIKNKTELWIGGILDRYAVGENIGFAIEYRGIENRCIHPQVVIKNDVGEIVYHNKQVVELCDEEDYWKDHVDDLSFATFSLGDQITKKEGHYTLTISYANITKKQQFSVTTKTDSTYTREITVLSISPKNVTLPEHQPKPQVKQGILIQE